MKDLDVNNIDDLFVTSLANEVVFVLIDGSSGSRDAVDILRRADSLLEMMEKGAELIAPVAENVTPSYDLKTSQAYIYARAAWSRVENPPQVGKQQRETLAEFRKELKQLSESKDALADINPDKYSKLIYFFESLSKL